MPHIRQKRENENDVYTIVYTVGWTGELEEHPSIVENPDVFEITNEPIPEKYQILRYI